MRQEMMQGPCESLRKAFKATLGSHTELCLGGQAGIVAFVYRQGPMFLYLHVKMRDRNGSAVEVSKGSAAA